MPQPSHPIRALTGAAIIAAALLLLPVPASGTAADDLPPIERIAWRLAAFTIDGVEQPVPAGTRATLFMDAGDAAGLDGCNEYRVAYSVDPVAIVFGSPTLLTELDCASEAARLEDAFLSGLTTSAVWSLDDASLVLSDADGVELLRFSRSAADVEGQDLLSVVTEVAAIRGELAALEAVLEEQRVPRLRDRVIGIEAVVESLRDQLDRQQLIGIRTRLGGIEVTLRETIERAVAQRARMTALEERVADLEAALEALMARVDEGDAAGDG